ncbi:hypothetical protein [Aeromicrobium sp.]|uniref:hypothetical protein n=1 Tax=Aeromicrobium sp. TaxID=1871063 RepID=UPI0019BA5F5F|nr:hypothetical protein [Aeromicrobium sp.]MBC7632604.1 hypothetical protein [Aeromicrobium sp.]
MIISEGITTLAAVCPKAPPGAQTYVNDITGYIQWGVLAIFAAAVLVAIGAIAAGRMFGMAHASKVGIISAVVVFFAAIGYMIVPAMIDSVTGSGCV